MGVWKLSIQPSTGDRAFRACQRASLIGVGWSHVFENSAISSKAESYAAASEGGAVPGRLRAFCDDLKTGDLVWLHQGGAFFLCKVLDSDIVLGPSICPDFAELDLGHARRVAWVTVPTELVSGRIQRAVIAPTAFQAITATRLEEETFNL